MRERRKLICTECQKAGIITELEVYYAPGAPYICPRYHLVTAPEEKHPEERKAKVAAKEKRLYPAGTFVLSAQPDKIRKEYLLALKNNDAKTLKEIVNQARKEEKK